MVLKSQTKLNRLQNSLYQMITEELSKQMDEMVESINDIQYTQKYISMKFKHSGKFLFSIPSDARLIIRNEEFRCMMRMRLDIELQFGKPLKKLFCNRSTPDSNLDNYHCLTCKVGGPVQFRHEMVKRTIQDIATQAQIKSNCFAAVLDENGKNLRGDLQFCNSQIHGGADVIHPNAVLANKTNYKIKGNAAIIAENKKINKYKKTCETQNKRFLLFEGKQPQKNRRFTK